MKNDKLKEIESIIFEMPEVVDGIDNYKIEDFYVTEDDWVKPNDKLFKVSWEGSAGKTIDVLWDSEDNARIIKIWTDSGNVQVDDEIMTMGIKVEDCDDCKDCKDGACKT